MEISDHELPHTHKETDQLQLSFLILNGAKRYDGYTALLGITIWIALCSCKSHCYPHIIIYCRSPNCSL